MPKKRGSVVVVVLALAAAVVGVLSLESQAAPQPPVDCSIVLCPAPPPTCPPGFKLGVPAGQCCPKCLPTR